MAVVGGGRGRGETAGCCVRINSPPGGCLLMRVSSAFHNSLLRRACLQESSLLVTSISSKLTLQ